jgi:hypothetical protein
LSSFVSSIMTPSSIRLELPGIDPVRALGAKRSRAVRLAVEDEQPGLASCDVQAYVSRMRQPALIRRAPARSDADCSPAGPGRPAWTLPAASGSSSARSGPPTGHCWPLLSAWLAPGRLLALGLGTLIRRTAGAIAALIGLVLTLPVPVQACRPRGRPTSPNTCHRSPGRPSSAAPDSRRPATCCSMGGLRAVLRLCRRHAHRRHHVEPARCLTPRFGFGQAATPGRTQCAGSVPAAAEWVALCAAGAVPRRIVRSE